MTTGRLSLAHVQCMSHIGVTEEERRERQRLEIDLELEADLGAAGASGRLADTVDYRAVCEAVRGHIERGSFHLVEVVAHQVLDLVLASFPPVTRARVRVRKFVLPKVGHVEVMMERARRA